jgi:archaellum component FlaC
MKDQIKAMNDMSEALENDAPKSKLEEIGKRTKEINEKFEGLSLSDEEKKKLVEKHKDELAKATVRLQAAMMKSMGDGFPGMSQPGKLP